MSKERKTIMKIDARGKNASNEDKSIMNKMNNLKILELILLLMIFAMIVFFSLGIFGIISLLDKADKCEKSIETLKCYNRQLVPIMIGPSTTMSYQMVAVDCRKEHELERTERICVNTEDS